MSHDNGKLSEGPDPTRLLPLNSIFLKFWDIYIYVFDAHLRTLYVYWWSSFEFSTLIVQKTRTQHCPDAIRLLPLKSNFLEMLGYLSLMLTKQIFRW